MGSPQPGRSDKDEQLTQLLQQARDCDARGESDRAATLYQAVLDLDPHNFDALDRLAATRAQQGNLDEAVKLMREALIRKPNSPLANLKLGNLLFVLGRLEEAKARYESATALKPDFSDAHYNLGVVMQALNQPAAAMEHYERVLALRGDYAEAHVNLGNLLYGFGRHAEAEVHYEQALHIKPDCAEALSNLGNTLHALGRYQEAKARYEQAIDQQPDFAEAHSNLATVLLALGEHERAIACCQRALTLKPNSPEMHNGLGNALQDCNRCAEAITQYQRALALRADYSDALNNLGKAQQAIGQIAEARQSFESAIALAPLRTSFYRNLSECKTFAPGDPHLRTMEELATEAASLAPDERMNLHFALGKALADLAQHERSFAHFQAGNALKRERIVYDEAKSLARIGRIRAVFTPQLMRAKAGLGNASTVPVFIVGMPRSGSTLVEQILAGHPDVFGAGELDDFNELVQTLRRDDGAPIGYPDGVPELGGATLSAIGSCYLDRLHRRAPTAVLRITDKMPWNWFLAGMIHLVLPNARIIHMRRDAIDTCLSCFSTLFLAGQPWSYELGELGRHYRAYATTMAHWRAVLPPGAMLEIRYEEVVADLEGQARHILAYCGLDWNEACLDFHRLQRPVKTASAAQVRQPLYQSSVGRSRHHRERLQPLLDALGPDLVGK